MVESNSGSNSRPHCLIVDDDDAVTEIIRESLKLDDYVVESVGSGEAAIEKCRTEDIDVVLLDYSLPGISGQQVCQAIREFSDAYILMVSANDNEVDRVLTLALGADDYVTKPFSSSELTERVRAMLRRPRHHAGVQRDNDPNRSQYVKRIGDLTFDTDTRLAATENGYVDLTELESNLLSLLVAGSPEAISRKEIVKHIWDRDYTSDDHIVDVHISNIRSKLRTAGLKGVRIQSVRSHGYRLLPEAVR